VAHEYPFDWKRTLAFAPHQDTAAMVYLNSRRRHGDPNAPIQTPREEGDARLAVSQALTDAIHPDTGTRLFPRVIDLVREHGIDPAALGYPDLIALPDDPYWVRTRLSSGRNWVEPDSSLPGTHRPEGIVTLCSSGVTPGASSSADLQDVAPTVLALLGMPIPEHMEGRAFAGEARTSSLRFDRPSAAVAAPHEPTFEYTPEEQAVIEQRLADLGYLE
jgi:predicted AlkP superfamily phosphohydrolase/phosphomutase